MPITIATAGARKTIAAASVMVGGTVRPALTIKQMIGGTIRTIFNAATATPGTFTAIANRNANARSFSGQSQRLTTNTVTMMSSGGASPYSYAWTITASDGGTISITDAANATTAFSTVVANGTVTASAKCVVRESGGATFEVVVGITFINESRA